MGCPFASPGTPQLAKFSHSGENPGHRRIHRLWRVMSCILLVSSTANHCPEPPYDQGGTWPRTSQNQAKSPFVPQSHLSSLIRFRDGLKLQGEKKKWKKKKPQMCRFLSIDPLLYFSLSFSFFFLWLALFVLDCPIRASPSPISIYQP